jgi:hypothetical protein
MHDAGTYVPLTAHDADVVMDASDTRDAVAADGGVAHDECAPFRDTPGATTEWARVDATGKLAYASLPNGEHLLDFSNAVRLDSLHGHGHARPQRRARDLARAG